jgi:hypothetical protein
VLHCVVVSYGSGLFSKAGEEKAMRDETKEADQQVELRDEERQRCEVWTRVMGYHRPVASFNIGKKGEHRERRFFREARVAGK